VTSAARATALPDVAALRARVAALRTRLAGDDEQDVDWAEVEQIVSGCRRRGASTAVKRVAVARLTDRGLSAREIGERIGMPERSVVRHRAARPS